MTVPDKPTLEGLEAKWDEWWDEAGTYRFKDLRRLIGQQSEQKILAFAESYVTNSEKAVCLFPVS